MLDGTFYFSRVLKYMGTALTLIGRDIIHDRALVGVCPCVPVEGDLVACLNVDEILADLGRLVAGYVRGSEIRGLDEADILVQSVPAGGSWCSSFRVVVPDRVRPSRPLAVDSDPGNETMSQGELRQEGNKPQKSGVGFHGGKMSLAILPL